MSKYCKPISDALFKARRECRDCALVAHMGRTCPVHFKALIASETCADCGNQAERQNPSEAYPEGRVMTQCKECHAKKMGRNVHATPEKVLCRNGLNCTFPRCIFAHPEGFVPVAAAPQQKPQVAFPKRVCKYDAFPGGCKNPQCTFDHPSKNTPTQQPSMARHKCADCDRLIPATYIRCRACNNPMPENIETPSPTVEKHSPILDEEPVAQ
jgi:hypothetical protein